MALAPDDIKVVSLEKLDDLFRLDVIDETTKVWRPGMTEWLPLGVVAGIEADPPSSKSAQEAPSSRGPGSAAAPSSRTAPPTPPPPEVLSITSLSSLGSAPFSGVGTAVLDSPAPPAASTRPVPVAPVATARPVPVAPVATARPVPVAPVATARPVPVAPVATARPVSVAPAPAALSGMPLRDVAGGVPSPYGVAPHARGTGRAQRVMLALSVVVGLTVTLYRNDILREAARSAGREGEYQQIEAALGGPGFGTLRSLEKLGLHAK